MVNFGGTRIGGVIFRYIAKEKEFQFDRFGRFNTKIGQFVDVMKVFSRPNSVADILILK